MNPFRVKRAANDDATFVVLGTFAGRANTVDNGGNAIGSHPASYFLIANERSGVLRYLEATDFVGHYEYLPEWAEGVSAEEREEVMKGEKTIPFNPEAVDALDPTIHKYELSAEDTNADHIIVPPLDAEDPRSYGNAKIGQNPPDHYDGIKDAVEGRR